MTQKKKKLTDDQCALRKFVAMEVGMTKADMQAEIQSAIESVVQQRMAHINVIEMANKVLADALGKPSDLSARIDKLIRAKIESAIESEIKKMIKLPDEITIKIGKKP